MDQQVDRHVFAERTFWAGCAIAGIGGIGSVIAGASHTNRLSGVVVPFVVAACGFAVLALMHQRGRAFSTLAYIVTGLAIAYGLLLALAVPLRLAVEGTCPPAPQRCTSGAELQLSNSEMVALTIAVTFGVLALFVGYFGLVALYRMRRPGEPAAEAQPVWPAQEPAAWRRRAAKAAASSPANQPAAKDEQPAEEPKAAGDPKPDVDDPKPEVETPPSG